MAKADDERSPHGSGEAGEKIRKRPFRPEISQNVSDEAERSVSCLNTQHSGNCGGISATAGKSELEKTLKQMTFTRSETQHLMSLLQSRTMEEEEEESATPLVRVEASITSGSIKRHKTWRVVEKEIAKTNATCLSVTPMASPYHPATIENLPCELLTNIFIRLLAKQLGQMRSVSKSWNALLSESSFIKSHLHHSILNSDQILLVFHGKITVSNTIPLTVKPTQSPNMELTNFIKLPVNPESRFICDFFRNGIAIIGSVNGLICSCYADFLIHIWNPSLSAMLTLPLHSIPSDISVKYYFRFGYDPKTDDYKVVKLSGLTGSSKHIIRLWLQVEIYSMRKGSWEVITKRFPSHVKKISVERFACTDGHNGYLHWVGGVGDKDVSDTIVAFDLGSETFHEIPLPFSTRAYNNVKCIGVLAEKLCVMLFNEDVEYQVWVMEEYGVAESWVKRHVFSPSFKYSVIFGITSRGEFFVDGDRCLVLYNPSAKEQKHLEDFMAVGHFLDRIVEYVDSLVWVAPTRRDMRCKG